MPPRPPGPFPLPGITMPTWMIRFDKNGRCVSPATRDALLASLATGQPADVIFFSHGWQTDFVGAQDLYTKFLLKLEALDDEPLPARRFVFVGITWPSRWLPGTQGPDLASADSGGDVGARTASLEDLAATLAPDDAAALYALADQPTVDTGDAERLAELLLRATAPSEDEQPDLAATPDIDEIMTAWRALSAATPSDTDFENPGLADGSGGVAAAGDLKFDPVDAIRIFSLYQMKDRAGRVGAAEVSTLLQGIAARSARTYAVGHSFGCKVMLSAVKRAAPLDPAKVKMLLLQPALSHLAFSRNLLGSGGPAGYADAPAKVARIFTTFSRQDGPLHDIFHLALLRKKDVGDLDALTAAGAPPNRFAALGGYGPREVEFAEIPIASSAADYADTEADIVALNGDDVIEGHGDVSRLETVRALRRLMD